MRCQRLDDVSLGDYPCELFICVHHRQAAYPVSEHDVSSVRQVGVFVDGKWVWRHEVACNKDRLYSGGDVRLLFPLCYQIFSQSPVASKRPGSKHRADWQKVTTSYHSDRTAVLYNHNARYLVAVHEQDRHVYGLVRRHGKDPPGHELVDQVFACKVLDIG